METITLGGYTLPVVPQKHARLRHRLSGQDLEKILSGEYSHETYRVLGVLIPELPKQMPEWEWDGYTSEEAWKNQAYDENNDPSPTTAEVVDAFAKALEVSGAGRLGKLLDMVTSTRRMAEQAQAEQAKKSSEQPTTESPDSPGESGE